MNAHDERGMIAASPRRRHAAASRLTNGCLGVDSNVAVHRTNTTTTTSDTARIVPCR